MEGLCTDGRLIIECNVQNTYQSKQIYLDNRFYVKRPFVGLTALLP